MDAPIVRKPIIIALYSDTPKCGKTTVANLIDTIGCQGTKLSVCHTYKFSFATPIKEVIFQLLRSLGVKDPDKYEQPQHKDTIIPELGKISSCKTVFLLHLIIKVPTKHPITRQN